MPVGCACDRQQRLLTKAKMSDDDDDDDYAELRPDQVAMLSALKADNSHEAFKRVERCLIALEAGGR